MTNERQNFYDQHLQRVSRSFALCIQELNEPLREYVGLSYLLCRILDTVEDSIWLDNKLQQHQFKVLLEFLTAAPTQEQIENWLSAMPTIESDGEKILLNSSFELLSHYHNLPPEIKLIIKGPLQTMALGMAATMNCKANGELHVRNMLELNHYCFIVAGVVGEILTLLAWYLEDQNTKTTTQNPDPVASLHFGLFLQKINILKDQEPDSKRGFYFIPNKQKTLASLKNHAEQACRYLLSLPETWLGFRLFCSFSLALGLISLPYLDQGNATKPDSNPQSSRQQRPKWRRADTLALLEHLKNISSHNGSLAEYLEACLEGAFADVNLSFVDSPPPLSQDLLNSRWDPMLFYQGQMNREKLIYFFNSQQEPTTHEFI